jgi:hypothetical protein
MERRTICQSPVEAERPFACMEPHSGGFVSAVGIPIPRDMVADCGVW